MSITLCCFFFLISTAFFFNLYYLFFFNETLKFYFFNLIYFLCVLFFLCKNFYIYINNVDISETLKKTILFFEIFFISFFSDKNFIKSLDGFL